MKVAEFIKKLQEFDQNATMSIIGCGSDDRNQWTPVETTKIKMEQIHDFVVLEEDSGL